MNRLPCNECKEGPCKVKRYCALHTTLGMLAATKDPVGLVEAMYAVGFKFNDKTDSFIVR